MLCAGLVVAACGSDAVGPPQPIGNGCKNNVVRQNPNGWLLTNPEIHFDFWGDWSSQTKYDPNYFWSTWFNLIENDGVLSRLSEYGIHRGEVDPYYYGNNGSPALGDAGVAVTDAGAEQIDDSTIVPQLQHEIQFSQLPYPNDDTLYVVMLPPNITTVGMVKNSWSAYHNWAMYGSQRFTFAVVTFNNEWTNVYASHEIGEAATDPDLSSGYYDSATGEEVGDLCNGEGTSVSGIVVQTYWSQTLCDCQ